MNFETAFAHYQAHTATAEETALVERELEKYRLIEDYLAEQELPELPEDAAAAASAETKAVKRRLNRRTRNIVLISTAAVLAVVLLLQLVVSPLLNRRVYTDDLGDGSGYGGHHRGGDGARCGHGGGSRRHLGHGLGRGGAGTYPAHQCDQQYDAQQPGKHRS